MNDSLLYKVSIGVRVMTLVNMYMNNLVNYYWLIITRP